MLKQKYYNYLHIKNRIKVFDDLLGVLHNLNYAYLIMHKKYKPRFGIKSCMQNTKMKNNENELYVHQFREHLHFRCSTMKKCRSLYVNVLVKYFRGKQRMIS